MRNVDGRLEDIKVLIRGVETGTRGYPHPTSRVPDPDFGRNCCPDTRPARCRVLPDTRVGYPAPDTAGTRPDTTFLFYFLLLFVIIICIILNLLIDIKHNVGILLH